MSRQEGRLEADPRRRDLHQPDARHAAHPAVLWCRTASERVRFRRARRQCLRAGHQPARPADPRALRSWQQRRAHRIRGRLSGRLLAWLRHDVRLSRRAPHGSGTVACQQRPSCRLCELATSERTQNRRATRILGYVFRRYQSQPVDRVVKLINPILRGWVNYFAVGHSSECFSFIQDWVEKKVRHHMGRAQNRRGFGWKEAVE